MLEIIYNMYQQLVIQQNLELVELSGARHFGIVFRDKIIVSLAINLYSELS